MASFSDGMQALYDWLKTLSAGDAAHVQPMANGSPLAVSGIPYSYVLTAATTATAYPNWIDALNAKSFTFDDLTTLPVSGAYIAIGWSTTAADTAAVTAMLNAFVSQVTTPGTAYPAGFNNVAVINLNTKEMPEVVYDGTNTIKTVVVMTSTGTATLILRTEE